MKPTPLGGKISLPRLTYEVSKLTGWKAGREPKRDDAAGGGANDEIKVFGNGAASQEALFQRGQHSGWEDATDAAAINGKDAKVPICRPIHRNPVAPWRCRRIEVRLGRLCCAVLT